MTISSIDDPKAGPYNGNDVQTAFPFSFKTFSSDSLLVVRADADGVEYTLVLDSDYSVSLNADQDANPGGTLTYPISGTPLPTGETLTIVSDLDFTQPVDINNGGGFYPSVIEGALDRVTMLTKQMNSTLSRSLQLAVSTPDGVDVTLPSPVANQVIGWDADGVSLANYEADTSISTSVLENRLASPSVVTDGPAMIGYDPTLAYAADTVGHALGGVITVRVTGVAGDAALLQAAFTAANGTGKTVRVNGSTCLVNTSLSLANHAHYDIDWSGCNVEYTGAAGTYMLDMTQAGRINQRGGVFTGSGSNHFVKTAGSAAAQATTYPTIPAENLWSRQLRFSPSVVTGFATVFDFQNFTREVWIAGYITGNVTSVKITGKVVNLYGNQGIVLYSGVASSNALYVRGDAGDVTYRYAEGLFFQGAIMDTVGTAADVRDVYLLNLTGAQLKTSAGGYALDLTKGVCPLTRDIFLSDALMQGKLRVGTGLASTFRFTLHASGLSFSDVADTAIVISDYSKDVVINGASFNGGTGTPRMFSVGASCVGIRLYGFSAESAEYTNLPTIDSTSVGGVEAEFSGSFTPGIAFGGSSTGITYSVQSGRYYYRGGFITGFFKITLSNKGAQAGAATITGLPYAARLLNGTATIGKYSSMNTALTPILDITEGASVINIKTGAAGSEANYLDTAFSNTSLINGSFMYPVS